VKKDDNFEFYEPNVRQDITRANGRVTGTKSFNYFLIPKEPGTYKLSDYFRWIFFNTEKDRYDTLQSRLTLYVTGESKKNQVIQANDAGTFYDKMQNSDNELRRLDDTDWITTGIGLFTVLIFGASVYLVAKKP
jgi:outer membrane scaffolding protein for murein synthesis (MipA/OmpV family)